MVVVREQDRVDRWEVGCGDRRAGNLARRRPPAEGIPPAGGIERRIRQQPPAADFDQRGRPADVRDADAAYSRSADDVARVLAWASAQSRA